MATWGESSKSIGMAKDKGKDTQKERITSEWKSVSEPEGYIDTWQEPTEQGKNVEAMKKAIQVNAGHMTAEQKRKAETEMQLGASANTLSQLADRISSDHFQG